MLPEEDYFARLAIEADEMKREQPSFEPLGGDVTKWKGFIIGTNLYEGGVFVFEIHIPREYPFKPPVVKAKTKIWHPNFFNDRVCIGILGKDWAPANNIVDVVESLRFLLSNPNPDDPGDQDDSYPNPPNQPDDRSGAAPPENCQGLVKTYPV